MKHILRMIDIEMDLFAVVFLLITAGVEDKATWYRADFILLLVTFCILWLVGSISVHIARKGVKDEDKQEQ